jgi:alkylhydroperoxidase family enzyme
VSSASAPRLAPLPKEKWDDDVREALRRGFGQKGADRLISDGPDAMPVPNVVSTLMHHPRLTGPWLAYNSVLLGGSALDPRLRELMILRVAWRTRSTYEWAQHARMANRVGIAPEEIDAIAQGDGAWSPLEADLLAATDQLIDRYRIDGDTWTRLAEQLDERQLVETVFIVGTYTCLAMAFNSFGLQLDSELQTTTIRLPESEE